MSRGKKSWQAFKVQIWNLSIYKKKKIATTFELNNNIVRTSDNIHTMIHCVNAHELE